MSAVVPEARRSVLKLSLGVSLLAVVTILAAVFVVGAPMADAAVCSLTAGVGLSWNAPGNWSCGHVPGSTGFTGDTAQICTSSVNVDTNLPNGVILSLFCTGATVNIPLPSTNSLQIEASSLVGSGGNLITVNGGNLTLNSGAGILNSACSITVNSGTASNSGNYATATLGGPLTIAGGTFTNNGNIQINPGGALNLSGGTLTNNVINGLTITGGAATAGTMVWSGGILNGGGSTRTLSNTVNGSLTINGANSAMTLASHTIDNFGTIAYSAPGVNPLSIDSNAVINNSGTFTLNSDTAINSDGTGVINNSGTFTKSGAATTSTINAAFNNGATVNFGGPSGLGLSFTNGGTHTGTFTFGSSSSFAFNGTHIFNTGAAFSGSGPVTISGGSFKVYTGLTIPGNLNNSGDLFFGPGATTQGLSVSGNYTQSAAGTLNIKLNGTVAGSQYDQVRVTGSATLAGTVTATLGYSPVDNQSWDIITDASVSGDFATKNLPPYARGQVFEVPSPPSGTVVTLVAVPQSDIQVTKSGPGAVADGQNASFTVTVSNLGPASPANVNITDTFSAGWSFVSATPSTGSCLGTGPINCNFPALATGSPATVVVVLKATAPGSQTNTASLSSASPADPNSLNDTQTATVVVNPAADQSISSVSGAPNPVSAAQPVTWTINAANAGPDAASSSVINISLLSGTISSASSSNLAFTCTNTPTTAQCTAASFASGATTIITVISQAPNQAGVMGMNANITSSTADLNAGNNSSSGTVTVTAVADVSVTKTLSPPLVAGQNAVYTVMVTNSGPSDAANVQVTDPTPPGLTFVSNSGACSTPYPCNLGTLTSGSSVTITTTYSVPASATGSVSNTATVSTTTSDPNAANNSSTATSAITTSADLQITKSFATPLVAGQNVTYTIAVKNFGPSDATSVTVTDPTPVGLTFVSNSGACTTAFPCSLGTLAASSIVTITSTYSVPSNASGTITNTATVSSATPDPTAGNNSSTASAVVGQSADVSVTKTGPATATANSNVTYTITVVNGGPSDASSVSLGDPTPSGATFISASGACSSFPCSLGTMTAGQSKTVTAIFKVGTGTTVNTATVTSGTPDPNSGNNSASVTTNTSCPSSAPTPFFPADGATNVPVNSTLSWSNVNSSGYTVYLDVFGPNGTCSKFFAATGVTSAPFFGLDPGVTYQWRVEATTPGCPTLSSACVKFTTISNCPTTPPTPTSPVNTSVSGSATFTWSAVAGAVDYKLFVNGALIATTSATTFGPVPVSNGPVSWYVIAEFAPPCAPLQSQTATFNGCNTADAPIPSLVAQAASGEGWDLTYPVVAGATGYQVDESTDASFVPALTTTQTVTATTVHYQHSVNVLTAFYYRVRAVLSCGVTVNSVVVHVVVAPATPLINPNVSVPVGNKALVQIPVHIPGFPGQTLPFTASLDNKPWLIRVEPSSGALPPEGIDLIVFADPTGLPNGTFTGTVILLVTTPGSGSITNQGVTKVNAPVSISLVTPVTPKPAGAPTASSLIVPSAGHLDGINSKWQSDVFVANTSQQKVKYQLTFSPDDAAKGVKQTIIDVDAGATTALVDIVKTWYGIGSLGEAANGVLEIRPFEASGKGAPANDDVSVSLTTVASSRAYNVSTTSTATLGQFIPALPFSGFVGRALDTAHAATILGLQQIAQNDSFRTNVGVLEASGQPASVLISAFDGNGNKLLDFPLDLKGGEQRQLNSFLAQNKISLTDGRLEVKVTGGEGKITAYASVVDGKSGDPYLVSGVPLGQNAFDHFVLPGVADLNTGFAAWRTDMQILNPSSTPQFVTMTFNPQNGGGAPQMNSFTINAGQLKRFDNILASTFGVTNTGGAIHVTTQTASPLVVTGRTFNLTSNGTFGQFVPAVTASDAVGLNGRSLQILQAEDSVRYRTNVGISEVTGKPATVEVSVFLPDSKISPSTQIPIPASGFVQIPVIQSLGLTNTYNARISLRVVGGDGKISAYGSVIDQITQAPTYIPAQQSN
jgi:uncharacterized repeat protein (TIGR01451 family)